MQDNFSVQSIIANYFELFGIKDVEEVKTFILSLPDNNDHIIFLMNWIKGTMFIPTDHAKTIIVKFRENDNTEPIVSMLDKLVLCVVDDFYNTSGAIPESFNVMLDKMGLDAFDPNQELIDLE
ncbi:MAG: hypothetical protein ACJ0OY_03360 [Dehalococcoidia bacterium]|nr:hypothetical protein [Chloroflexota bacterium]|tara:strand:+ start:1531 stop:1899 length:369 start_codon:yes stop_codon:yes gene_type:complete